MSLYYTLSVTGDCQNTNSGILEIFPSGGTLPYIVDWFSPNLGIDNPVTTGSTRNSLSAGTYSISITDATMPLSQTLYLNLIVSSGVCATIENHTDTTCGEDNGIIYVTADSAYSPLLYNVVSMTTGLIVASSSTYSNSITFQNLSADTYYVEVYDGGGCSGNTGTVIIHPSDEFNYGLYVVNNSGCAIGNTGKIYVTGQTGSSPYTYLWSNGETTSSIGDLTDGVYSVVVTDSLGCSVTKSATVETISSISVIGFIHVSPSCFQSDGELIVNITGGTPPYYYQFSNGENLITYSNSVTFENLSSGFYSVTVTDAALCTATASTTLSSPNAFTVVSIIATPSTCSEEDGDITITVVGGATPYTYTIRDTFGNEQVSVTTSPTITFNGLATGLYVVSIENVGECFYQTVVFVNNTNRFAISTSAQDTTCGLNNGEITISVDTPGTYSYEIEGNLIPNTTEMEVLFNNLAPGIYNVVVTDDIGCTQTTQVIIESSEFVSFTFDISDCGSGDQGTITALITSGNPPYLLEWSDNVGGQTGIYLTGLTAGTYTLTITDSDGCQLTKETTLRCPTNYVSYELYNVCEEEFIQTGSTKTGIQEIFNQGFLDLIQGEENCRLQGANFTTIVNIGSSSYTDNFYSTTSLTDYPTDEEYADSIRSILSGVTGIGAIIIDPETNSIILNTDCDRSLWGKTIQVYIKITYQICCITPPN